MRSILLVAAVAAIMTLPSITHAQDEQKADDERKVVDLEELGRKLREAVENGEMTGADAKAKYMAAAEAAEKMRQEINLEQLGMKLKEAIANGEMTEDEAMAKFKEASAMMKTGGKGGGMMQAAPGGATTFYAIIIGRLKSKDIELGEFTLEVDHVTSIYGNRSPKERIMGETITITGVSGEWLDRLLLMRVGETLKFRSGTIHELNVMMSPKAPVLEQAPPFDPETYPIPPETFRGFKGIVTGKIESKSDQGYELIVRVDTVNESFPQSGASDPESIRGRLIEMRGFYDGEFRTKFDDLKLGDTIRVGAAHNSHDVDSLDVTRVLEKVEN